MFLPYFCTPVKKTEGELVAQLVEQYTFNVWALGSSPSQFTEKESRDGFFFLWVRKCFIPSSNCNPVHRCHPFCQALQSFHYYAGGQYHQWQ